MENINPEVPVQPQTDPAAHSLKREVYAGFFIRVAAHIADLLTVNYILLFLNLYFFLYLSLPRPGAIFIYTAEVIFYFTYLTVTTKIWGKSAGKYIFRLKIKRDDGEEIDWKTAVRREILGRILCLVTFYAGYLKVIFSKNKKALHDSLAGVTVIREADGTQGGKILAILIFVLPILIIPAALLSVYFFQVKYQYDRQRTDLLETVSQKISILDAVSGASGSGALIDCFKLQKTDYRENLGKLCLSAGKSPGCIYSDLDNGRLISLNARLETDIKNLVDCQTKYH